MLRSLMAMLVAAAVVVGGCSREASKGEGGVQGAAGHDGNGHGSAGGADSDDRGAPGHEEASDGDAGHSGDELEGAAMSKEAKAGVFAALITGALREGDTDTVVAHMKGVNLPEGWQEMIVPMLNGLEGYELAGVIRPRSEFTNEDLHWPEETPEALKEVETILYVHYGDDNSSGSRSFPLVYRDGEWWILLAQ